MNAGVFEVRVNVKERRPAYSTNLGKIVQWGKTRMYHIHARTARQAGDKARKYGNVLSVRKVSEKVLGLPEKTILQQNPPLPIYENAIAMDEFIWRKKQHEARREINLQNDHQGY